PAAVFNIDFKDDAGVERGLEQIARRGAQERVIVASFSNQRLARVRSHAPHVLTSASQAEVARMRFGRRPPRLYRPMELQITERIRGKRVPTRVLLRGAHNHGIQVHAWTTDDPAAMHRLGVLGVDGIISDRPAVLKGVLIDRGEWPT